MPFDAINIQLRKLVDICAYELPTNVQNFTQKRLTRSESIPKSFRRGYFFSVKHPVRVYSDVKIEYHSFAHKKSIRV